MNNVETNLIPIVKGFFHKQSGTISYVVIDSTTNLCAILDTVLDFDYSTGSIFFEHADTVIDFVNENKLNVEWLIETHVHADHLSAAPYIQKKLGGKLCISKEIIKVQITLMKDKVLHCWILKIQTKKILGELDNG